MIEFRHMAIFTALLALCGCANLPQREKEAPPLTRASSCQVGADTTVGVAPTTPVARMAMNNDGGWCWMNSVESLRGMSFGPFLKTVREPTNGALMVNVLEQSTRVAYRPNPGFTGVDTFRTRSMETNFEVEYRVEVAR